MRLAAERETQEFALFSGPRLEQVTSNGNIVLIGDASHPLSGAFGAGAGFALEDVYALTQSIKWTWSKNKNLAEAIDLFDYIRSPHYKSLYGVLDKFAAISATPLSDGLSIDEEIEERVKRTSAASESWMYFYEVDKAVDKALREADQRDKNARAVEMSTNTAKEAETEKFTQAEESTQAKRHAGEIYRPTEQQGVGTDGGSVYRVSTEAATSEKAGAVSIEIDKIEVIPNGKIEIPANAA